MADFLLELLSEEIPARMQAKARNELARMFAECTAETGLPTGAIDTFSTPRRLVLIARDVAKFAEHKSTEVKGPRTSAPAQAIEGFLRKVGKKLADLEDRNGTYFLKVDMVGLSAEAILQDTIRRIVASFPWPKSMRWGDGSLRWVRPLHGIVAILGEDIVPVEIDGIVSGATTVGHRFHHPGAITIGGAADYVEKLRACHVIVDQDERERLIREGAEAAAVGAGLRLLPDEGLVVENAGLTEWPVPLLGQFDCDYLDVPREVIVLTMRTNQKYFACTNDEGLLAPAFVCVANIAASDGGASIVEGNRRVLAARLADARFFWEQDLKVPLEEQAKKLDGIVFHEKLGTVADKVERVAKLGRWLVEQHIVTPAKAGAQPNEKLGSRLRGNDGEIAELADRVERAARLAKADLVTGMVGEFPELQGVIGGYLAVAQGEPQAVADAIRDHYKPAGQGDEVPTAAVTVAVALADKLDTLAGFYFIDEKPSGSRDPFALRRAALAAISLIATNNIRINLKGAIDEIFPLLNVQVALRMFKSEPLTRILARGQPSAMALGPRREDGTHEVSVDGVNVAAVESEYVQPLFDWIVRSTPSAEWRDDLLGFFADRLKVQQREAGVRHDLIDAVFALGYEDDLVRLLARVKALQHFIQTAEGADLLTAYKRAANILKKENWTGPQVMSSRAEQGIPQTGEEDPLVLVEEPGLKEAIAEMASGQAGADLPQEKALIAALDAAEPKASAAVEAEDFTGAMAALASLRRPIDEFFDHVTVNDPDAAKRERRLNLLMRFRDAVNAVADFSRIEG